MQSTLSAYLDIGRRTFETLGEQTLTMSRSCAIRTRLSYLLGGLLALGVVIVVGAAIGAKVMSNHDTTSAEDKPEVMSNKTDNTSAEDELDDWYDEVRDAYDLAESRERREVRESNDDWYDVYTEAPAVTSTTTTTTTTTAKTSTTTTGTSTEDGVAYSESTTTAEGTTLGSTETKEKEKAKQFPLTENSSFMWIIFVCVITILLFFIFTTITVVAFLCAVRRIPGSVPSPVAAPPAPPVADPLVAPRLPPRAAGGLMDRERAMRPVERSGANLNSPQSQIAGILQSQSTLEGVGGAPLLASDLEAGGLETTGGVMTEFGTRTGLDDEEGCTGPAKSVKTKGFGLANLLRSKQKRDMDTETYIPLRDLTDEGSWTPTDGDFTYEQLGEDGYMMPNPTKQAKDTRIGKELYYKNRIRTLDQIGEETF